MAQRLAFSAALPRAVLGSEREPGGDEFRFCGVQAPTGRIPLGQQEVQDLDAFRARVEIVLRVCNLAFHMASTRFCFD